MSLIKEKRSVNLKAQFNSKRSSKSINQSSGKGHFASILQKWILARLGIHFSTRLTIRLILLVFQPYSIRAKWNERDDSSIARSRTTMAMTISRGRELRSDFFAKDDIDQSIVKVNDAGSGIPNAYIATASLPSYLRHAMEERAVPQSRRAIILFCDRNRQSACYLSAWKGCVSGYSPSRIPAKGKISSAKYE